MKKNGKDSWKCGPFVVWGEEGCYEIRICLRGCHMTDYVKGFKTRKSVDSWLKKQTMKMIKDILNDE